MSVPKQASYVILLKSNAKLEFSGSEGPPNNYRRFFYTSEGEEIEILGDQIVMVRRKEADA